MSVARTFKVNSFTAILTFPANMNSFWITSTIQTNSVASADAHEQATSTVDGKTGPGS
jgi:hypothetical protein